MVYSYQKTLSIVLLPGHTARQGAAPSGAEEVTFGNTSCMHSYSSIDQQKAARYLLGWTAQRVSWPFENQTMHCNSGT